MISRHDGCRTEEVTTTQLWSWVDRTQAQYRAAERWARERMLLVLADPAIGWLGSGSFVKGHRFMPTGGHETCPLVATNVPTGGQPFLRGRRQGPGLSGRRCN